ncbi:DUF2958 domain-containing protein [Variovorax boronicumulans]|jgi:Protein of unknown function (DUF2958)|nr:DUF2958 domain-containing protein [Variovorax boronicumulans]
MGNYQVRFRGRGRGQSLREPSPLPDELDPDDEDRAYGLCDLGMGTPEPGPVSLRELKSIRLMGGALGIERDLYWKANKPLSEYARLARRAGRIVD